jgi:hypothetical protein
MRGKALNGLVVRFLMTMSEVAEFIRHTPYHNEREGKDGEESGGGKEKERRRR